MLIQVDFSVDMPNSTIAIITGVISEFPYRPRLLYKIYIINIDSIQHFMSDPRLCISNATATSFSNAVCSLFALCPYLTPRPPTTTETFSRLTNFSLSLVMSVCDDCTQRMTIEIIIKYCNEVENVLTVSESDKEKKLKFARTEDNEYKL